MAKPRRPGDRLDEGVVFGRYVLLHELGVGAMGVVYAALDPDLNRKVALKLLRTDRLDRPDLDERLLREARAMAKVDHENVATVHDFGRIGDRLYVAMEYIEGDTLKAWYEAGPHPQARVLELLTQAGEGLAAAHRAGLVHRDFKPDNVMIDASGNARVLDFGLVRDIGPAEQRIDGDGPKLTRVGARLGTPAYMAPEQHRGAQASSAADQFAFGVALFEGLYGHRPFAGKTRNAISMKILARSIEPVAPELQRPAWQHAAIVRCLEPDPAERWPSMDELLRALAADPEKRRRRATSMVLVGTLAVAALSAVVWFGAGSDQRRACEHAVEADGSSLGESLDGLDGRVVPERLTHELRESALSLREYELELCVARKQGGRSETWLSLHDRCLAYRRAELRGILLAASDVADSKLDALRTDGIRSSIARCGDVEPHPDSSGSNVVPAEQRLDQRVQLSRAKALVVADPMAATSIAEADSMDITEEGDPELYAIRALVLGTIALAEGANSDATAHLEAAAAAALRHDHHRLAAQAWISLARLERASGNEDAARNWDGYARAALVRAGGDPVLEAALTPSEAAGRPR